MRLDLPPVHHPTMPSIHPGDKVLVTGASGYIAVWIVKYLLDNGFSVRGTVRSVEKGEHLKEFFKEYSPHFEYVVVEDIAAVRECNAPPRLIRD